MNPAGGSIPVAGGYATPAELWNLDVKMDDGKPMTGKVFIENLSGTFLANCTNTVAANNSDWAADYLFTATTTECNQGFILGL